MFLPSLKNATTSVLPSPSSKLLSAIQGTDTVSRSTKFGMFFVLFCFIFIVGTFLLVGKCRCGWPSFFGTHLSIWLQWMKNIFQRKESRYPSQDQQQQPYSSRTNTPSSAKPDGSSSQTSVLGDVPDQLYSEPVTPPAPSYTHFGSSADAEPPDRETGDVIGSHTKLAAARTRLTQLLLTPTADGVGFERLN